MPMSLPDKQASATKVLAKLSLYGTMCSDAQNAGNAVSALTGLAALAPGDPEDQALAQEAKAAVESAVVGEILKVADKVLLSAKGIIDGMLAP